jgi:hypothetical protein
MHHYLADLEATNGNGAQSSNTGYQLLKTSSTLMKRKRKGGRRSYRHPGCFLVSQRTTVKRFYMLGWIRQKDTSPVITRGSRAKPSASFSLAAKLALSGESIAVKGLTLSLLTNRTISKNKNPVQPIVSSQVFEHIQIVLVDMSYAPCSYMGQEMKWICHIKDHFSKFSQIVGALCSRC